MGQLRFVLDSSAVIALVLGEAGSDLVDAAIEESVISTVSLAEVVEVLRRRGLSVRDARAALAALALPTIAPDEETAIEAGLLAAATRGHGLSLGDRFCFALARRLSAIALTADHAWLGAGSHTGIKVELIR